MASTAEGRLAFEGSATDFQSLEEKVYRAIELLKEARSQKAAAELELATLREMMEAQSAETESLRQQIQLLQQDIQRLRLADGEALRPSGAAV